MEPMEENMGKRPEEESIPEAIPYEPPAFEIDSEEGYKFLEQHGYAVFKDVLTQEEIEKSRGLAWDFLENFSGSTIKREDPSSWDTNWPDPFGNGIICKDAVGHCSFLWYVRGIPNVSKVFKKIWNTDQVVTSFDGFCMHRPFEYNPKWLTKGNWYHIDQNGKSKPDRICVQGLVNFYDSGPTDGGVVVVPDSIHVFKEITKDRSAKADYVNLNRTGETCWKNECKPLTPIKVCAKAGSLVLWDSRTIHCNTGATTAREIPKEGVLPPRRLVAYICMTPRSRLSGQVTKRRVEAFLKGHTSSHWPEECSTKRRTNQSPYTPLELTLEQSELIPLPPKKNEPSKDDDK